LEVREEGVTFGSEQAKPVESEEFMQRPDSGEVLLVQALTYTSTDSAMDIKVHGKRKPRFLVVHFNIGKVIFVGWIKITSVR